MGEEETVSEQGEEEEQPSEEQKEKHEEGSSAMKSIAKKVTGKALAVVVVSLIAGVLIGQVAMPGLGLGFTALQAQNEDIVPEDNVDLPALQEKVEAYINTNLLAGGLTANVTSIDTSGEGLFLANIEVSGDGETTQGQVFITKDGSTLVLGAENVSVFLLDKDLPMPEPVPGETQELQKSETPVVELFVMSYCPYGLQMEKALLPAWKLLAEKADITIRFCDYAMHDIMEIEENTRQYCIQKEQPEKLFDYMNCFVQSGDYEACLQSSGVDNAKLEACEAAADEEFDIMGLYNDKGSWIGSTCPDGPYCFPTYMVDAGPVALYGVGGSPTLVINGMTVSPSRSPEAVKQAICEAFVEQPEECSQVLSSDSASSGFGGGTGDDSQGYC